MSQDSQSPCILTFDTAVYRLSALKKAAYKFSGQYRINIAVVEDGQATMTVSCADPSVGMQSVLSALQREVTDQELREVILEETVGIRNLLLAQAFSATSLIEPNVDTEDYMSDPLGVSAPDVAPPPQSQS